MNSRLLALGITGVYRTLRRKNQRIDDDLESAQDYCPDLLGYNRNTNPSLLVEEDSKLPGKLERDLNAARGIKPL